VPFIAHRERRAGRYLEWKIGLFSIAAAITMVGIYLDERWMTGFALALLIAGMLLRFLPGGGGAGRATYIDDDDDEGGEDEDRSREDGEALV
jgi:hypothetical protein